MQPSNQRRHSLQQQFYEEHHLEGGSSLALSLKVLLSIIRLGNLTVLQVIFLVGLTYSQPCIFATVVAD
jgi:hypothetical protein